MVNLRPLTPHIMPSLLTKWRTCRDHRVRDVISHYVYVYVIYVIT